MSALLPKADMAVQLGMSALGNSGYQHRRKRTSGGSAPARRFSQADTDDTKRARDDIRPIHAVLRYLRYILRYLRKERTNAKPGRGQENEQTNDTGRNRIWPATLMLRSMV
jgi:hypothetical protein